ncbi:hypothetical protein FB45DRAFT_860005 [Roridomyces roridus]|uniref:F-box domain-containing protein n=1 Tax=Roridomyces roridus TaxID=1738132 RepID=A0AAD7CDK6_9AGAR|nr:hypothetical protein FB45DRAFT_860005 [Roridomyces roridus]
MFAIAPNLTAVYVGLENEDGVLYRSPFELPWQQLTTLSIGFHGNEEALPVIPLLSTIVNLRVQFTRADPFPAQSPITLPHLRMLEVRSEHISHPQDAILDFLARSQCQLKSFHFIEDAIGADDALALIREMPSLRDLNLGYFMVSEPPSEHPVSITHALYSQSGEARLLRTTAILLLTLTFRRSWKTMDCSSRSWSTCGNSTH